MNIFDRLGEFRNEVKNRVLHDQELLKLLKYTDVDPLSFPDLDMSEAWEIVGGSGNIFFQPRVIDTIESDKNILTMSIKGRSNRTAPHCADITLVFVILVDYNNFELIDGTCRLERIGSRLKELFDESSGKWLENMKDESTCEGVGDMKFVDFGDVTCPNNYSSLGLSFSLTDFK